MGPPKPKRPYADMMKGKKEGGGAGYADQDPERSQTPPLSEGSEEFSRPLGPPPTSKGGGFQVPAGMG